MDRSWQHFLTNDFVCFRPVMAFANAKEENFAIIVIVCFVGVPVDLAVEKA